MIPHPSPEESSMTTDPRCPATTSTTRMLSADRIGVQCKFTKSHEGDHWGFAGAGMSEISWPQDENHAPLTLPDPVITCGACCHTAPSMQDVAWQPDWKQWRCTDPAACHKRQQEAGMEDAR